MEVYTEPLMYGSCAVAPRAAGKYFFRSGVSRKILTRDVMIFPRRGMWQQERSICRLQSGN